ncbi:MAG TPA: hypothetical protein VNX88_19665 [Terriglobales bacterium]|nr:hypothetical protein [Terriglobales bacterium]
MSATTGYCERQVKYALKGLREKRFIEHLEDDQRAERGRFESWWYAMRDPETGESLCPTMGNRRKHINLRTVLHRSKRPWFCVPEWAISNLLPTLNGAVLSFYVATLQLATVARNDSITVPVTELRRLSALSHNTFTRVVEQLGQQDIGPGMLCELMRSGRSITVELRDPETGYPLDWEPWAETITQQRAERGFRPYPPEVLLDFATRVLRRDIVPAANEEFATRCPFCGNTKRRRPNLNLNVTKGVAGLFYCHDCYRGGTLVQLAMQHLNITKFEALKLVAKSAQEIRRNEQIVEGRVFHGQSSAPAGCVESTARVDGLGA